MYAGYKVLQLEKRKKILIVAINNPMKKNAISRLGYQEITRVLEQVNEDLDVTIIVLTGAGDYFTSGNDLSNMDDITDYKAYIKESNEIFNRMITAFIACTKVIVSLVNGPSIGIGATIMALSDIVWCEEQAYISTPFTKLGLVPEGCSSYLLPRIIGKSKANEMLLMGEPVTAQEAYHFNYVSRVYKKQELDTKIWPKLHEYSELPPGSLLISKKLITSHVLDAMKQANTVETAALYERCFSDEFMQALMNFASRKKVSKL